MYEDDDLPVSTKNNATAPTANTDLDVDFGDNDAVATGDALDRIYPSDKTSRVRGALLTHLVKAKMGWVHYVKVGDKKQTVRCQSVRDKARKNAIIKEGECCKKLNRDDDQRAQLNVAALGLQYTNVDPATGKWENAETPIKWKLGWYKFSPSGFRAIGKITLEGEKSEDFDFVTMAKEGNGIGYEYVRMTKNQPRYRVNPELVKEVETEAATYADGEFLTKRLGKVLTELELKALLSGASATQKDRQIDNAGDL